MDANPWLITLQLPRKYFSTVVWLPVRQVEHESGQLSTMFANQCEFNGYTTFKLICMYSTAVSHCRC